MHSFYGPREKPKSYREIKDTRRIRIRAPLADNVIIEVKACRDVSRDNPEDFGSIKGFDVTDLRFHFWGRRILVGSMHHLDLPLKPLIMPLTEKEGIERVVGLVIDRYQGMSQYRERLDRLKAKLRVNANGEATRMPHMLLLVNSITVSRLDTIIDFSFGKNGYSYNVTRLGVDPPHLVDSRDSKFVNISNCCFIRAQKSGIYLRDYDPAFRMFTEGDSLIMPLPNFGTG